MGNVEYASLSIEWNSIKLGGGPAHGIVTKTVHNTLSLSLFCLSKTGPCISSQISFKRTV